MHASLLFLAWAGPSYGVKHEGNSRPDSFLQTPQTHPGFTNRNRECEVVAVVVVVVVLVVAV